MEDRVGGLHDGRVGALLEELTDRLVQLRAAPGDRLVLLVEEELDRDLVVSVLLF